MVEQQQFCLRWNNHGSTLVAVFDNLLANESLVDVTLFVEGRQLKAHKVVLSACSPYFQTLFAQTTDKHPIVILKDVKHAELKALLEYMYRGEVNVAQDELGPLIKTAESLKIKGLADGSNRSEGESRSTRPPSHELPKLENPHPETICGRPRLDAFPLPQVSGTSVLSTVLNMPPALSLASSNLVPPIKLPNLNTTTGTPTDGSSHESNSPCAKRRKKMRRKSGETGESGDSDGRSSGSPGDSIQLPRIPATITPISSHSHTIQRDQLYQHRERERLFEREIERERERREHEQEIEWEREREHEREREREQERERDRERDREFREQLRTSSPSPENLVGSSRIPTDVSRSSPGITKPLCDYERTSLSPNKALSLLVRPDENSSDANHLSDDDYDDKGMLTQDHLPDTPGPSTSRPRPDDSQQQPNYLGWPYPPDTSAASDDSYSPLENTNQGHDLLSQVPNACAASPEPSAKLSDPLTSLASPASSPSSVPVSSVPGLLSPPSPNIKPSPDFLYLSNLRTLGLSHPSAVRNLDFITKALAQRAMSFTSQSDHNLQPLNLTSFGSLPYNDIKPFQGFSDTNYFQVENPNPKSRISSSSSSSRNGGGGSMGMPLIQATSGTNGGVVYTCHRCGKAYGVRRSLHRHQKFECGVEPKFPCPVCNKKCTHKFNLKQHMLSHHKQMTNL